jgi:hypothetical protein
MYITTIAAQCGYQHSTARFRDALLGSLSGSAHWSAESACRQGWRHLLLASLHLVLYPKQWGVALLALSTQQLTQTLAADLLLQIYSTSHDSLCKKAVSRHIV